MNVKMTFLRNTLLSIFTLGVKGVSALTSSIVPRVMKSLTVILSVCNNFPSMTPSKVKDVLVRNNDSVKNMFDTCSNGTMKFETYMVPYIVNIPCNTYNYNNLCDPQGWADYANEIILKNRLDLTSYKHLIYIIPEGCPFAGFGDVGPCGVNACRVWISNNQAVYPDTYMHELGHNLGLNHAKYNSDAYGDWSSAMGFCCEPRCYTAPQNNYLKWSKPKKVTYAPLNMSYELKLKPNEYIVIKEQGVHWYVQFRIKSKQLDRLRPEFTGLNVYSMSTMDTYTILHAIIQRNSSKWSPRLKVFSLYIKEITKGSVKLKIM